MTHSTDCDPYFTLVKTALCMVTLTVNTGIYQAAPLNCHANAATSLDATDNSEKKNSTRTEVYVFNHSNYLHPKPRAWVQALQC